MYGRIASSSAFLVATFSVATSLPEGYRYPTEADRTLDWEAFKAEVPVPFHAEADFNGDGLPDEAWILLRESGKGWGLFVFLGTRDRSHATIMLEEDEGRTAAQQMGVSVAEPGQ